MQLCLILQIHFRLLWQQNWSSCCSVPMFFRNISRDHKLILLSPPFVLQLHDPGPSGPSLDRFYWQYEQERGWLISLQLISHTLYFNVKVELWRQVMLYAMLFMVFSNLQFCMADCLEITALSLICLPPCCHQCPWSACNGSAAWGIEREALSSRGSWKRGMESD